MQAFALRPLVVLALLLALGSAGVASARVFIIQQGSDAIAQDVQQTRAWMPLVSPMAWMQSRLEDAASLQDALQRYQWDQRMRNRKSFAAVRQPILLPLEASETEAVQQDQDTVPQTVLQRLQRWQQQQQGLQGGSSGSSRTGGGGAAGEPQPQRSFSWQRIKEAVEEHTQAENWKAYAHALQVEHAAEALMTGAPNAYEDSTDSASFANPHVRQQGARLVIVAGTLQQEEQQALDQEQLAADLAAEQAETEAEQEQAQQEQQYQEDWARAEAEASEDTLGGGGAGFFLMEEQRGGEGRGVTLREGVDEEAQAQAADLPDEDERVTEEYESLQAQPMILSLGGEGEAADEGQEEGRFGAALSVLGGEAEEEEEDGRVVSSVSQMLLRAGGASSRGWLPLVGLPSDADADAVAAQAMEVLYDGDEFEFDDTAEDTVFWSTLRQRLSAAAAVAAGPAPSSSTPTPPLSRASFWSIEAVLACMALACVVAGVVYRTTRRSGAVLPELSVDNCVCVPVDVERNGRVVRGMLLLPRDEDGGAVGGVEAGGQGLKQAGKEGKEGKGALMQEVVVASDFTAELVKGGAKL